MGITNWWWIQAFISDDKLLMNDNQWLLDIICDAFKDLLGMNDMNGISRIKQHDLFISSTLCK